MDEVDKGIFLNGGLTHGDHESRRTETCAFESRKRLLDLSIGFVEDLRRTGVRPGKGPESYCSDFQVCLPYQGLFVWHVGSEDVVGDANQVVFCSPGESFRMSGVAEGYAEIIITPDTEVLSEIMQCDGTSMNGHAAFGRSWRADPRLQSHRTRFLHWASASTDRDTLAAEECVLLLLRSTFQTHSRANTSLGATSARIIRRTKEYLAAELSNAVRLMDVAHAVGVSPAYLTDLFRRAEGLPVHRYLMRLRLARALVELPHADDLTALALSLGFSSHSHFSFAFRKTFGVAPSQFREQARRPPVPPLS